MEPKIGWRALLNRNILLQFSLGREGRLLCEDDSLHSSPDKPKLHKPDPTLLVKETGEHKRLHSNSGPYDHCQKTPRTWKQQIQKGLLHSVTPSGVYMNLQKCIVNKMAIFPKGHTAIESNHRHFTQLHLGALVYTTKTLPAARMADLCQQHLLKKTKVIFRKGDLEDLS